MTERATSVRIPEPRERTTRSMEGFFPYHRRTRELRYASWSPGQGSDKRRAIQTIVQNEAVFLPLWLRYYSRFFAAEDIYVFDHQSTDGSTEGGGFVRIPVEHDTVDHTWMAATLEAHQHELLESHDVVLTVDVDEIVAPSPTWGTLGDYIDRLEEPWVNPLGYEIIHLRDREPPLDLGRPVLEQRGYWFANDGYNKPALTMSPLSLKPGLHPLVEEMRLDPDLYLIHLHRMDYDICLARHRQRGRRRWHGRDFARGWASHNRITEEEEFERWFYEDSSFEHLELVVEPIPVEWKGAF